MFFPYLAGVFWPPSRANVGGGRSTSTELTRGELGSYGRNCCLGWAKAGFDVGAIYARAPHVDATARAIEGVMLMP